MDGATRDEDGAVTDRQRHSRFLVSPAEQQGIKIILVCRRRRSVVLVRGGAYRTENRGMYLADFTALSALREQWNGR